MSPMTGMKYSLLAKFEFARRESAEVQSRLSSFPICSNALPHSAALFKANCCFLGGPEELYLSDFTSFSSKSSSFASKSLLLPAFRISSRWRANGIWP